MKRKRYPANDPREWLSRARSNLAVARHPIVGVDLEDLCFEAQQAAEKAIKAVFVKRGETFPFSHDLDRLLGLLKTNGLKVPLYVANAKELTQYAHVTRYPGLGVVVSVRSYRRAVRIATAAVQWAKRLVEPPARKQKGKTS